MIELIKILIRLPGAYLRKKFTVAETVEVEKIDKVYHTLIDLLPLVHGYIDLDPELKTLYLPKRIYHCLELEIISWCRDDEYTTCRESEVIDYYHSTGKLRIMKSTTDEVKFGRQ